MTSKTDFEECRQHLHLHSMEGGSIFVLFKLENRLDLFVNMCISVFILTNTFIQFNMSFYYCYCNWREEKKKQNVHNNQIQNSTHTYFALKLLTESV